MNCVVLVCQHPLTGKVFGVSRKDNSSLFGLIGGKVDPGESLQVAAAREFREETGFKKKDFVVAESPFFSGTDDGGLTTHAFEVFLTSRELYDKCEFISPEGTTIRQLDWDFLFDAENSPWPKYNRTVHSHIPASIGGSGNG